MNKSNVEDVLAAALRGRRLLEHPFYQRWERGQVSMDELGAYAAQYRHFERYLPTFLTRLLSDLPAGSSRELIAANLADEKGDPVPHLEMFERFASAVGAQEATMSSSTMHLLGTYDELLAEAPTAALAGFIAYECQASEISHRKADGLRRFHGLSLGDVSFWEHHAAVDVKHREWTLRAVEDSADDPVSLEACVRRGADAWWAFLDEREAAAV